MSPRITVALSVCPDGKLGEVSKGGTASDSGGRALPVSCLPVTVIASDPRLAMAMRTTGVHRRHASASPTATTTVMIGMTTGPPRSVKSVASSDRNGVRAATAASSTGWSMTEMPSRSTTFS